MHENVFVFCNVRKSLYDGQSQEISSKKLYVVNKFVFFFMNCNRNFGLKNTLVWRWCRCRTRTVCQRRESWNRWTCSRWSRPGSAGACWAPWTDGDCCGRSRARFDRWAPGECPGGRCACRASSGECEPCRPRPRHRSRSGSWPSCRPRRTRRSCACQICLVRTRCHSLSQIQTSSS